MSYIAPLNVNRKEKILLNGFEVFCSCRVCVHYWTLPCLWGRHMPFIPLTCLELSKRNVRGTNDKTAKVEWLYATDGFTKWVNKMRARAWECACQDIPVWDVSAANHGGQIGDGVASHACLVEPWVLTNQMTGQETAMRAPSNCHLAHVELCTFENTFNSELVGRKTRDNVCGGEERQTDTSRLTFKSWGNAK